MLEGFRSGRRPLVVHRFSSERDDTLPAETYNDLPDHLIVEGLILGYRGDGYGRVLDLIDLFVFLDVDAETAKARRFAREAELRDHGGGFTENEMQSFWDEVLEPALHRWVADARERADVVISIGRDNEVTVVSANEAVMAALEHR
jgi:uridine kinase